ncbi:hypothetical protein CYLTODRAFT_489541 [Cylindrobasidium torrendii FP15055 ss-10]|uniref:Extracellular metalloproteinase n=1 Tax=Cylindrobasidium torrendii FP15055 ss-10 TaxID=1314674 RepID=A0A0D7BEW8_9AGAR|nr:hypothetical protein CYLTODRAFT_489541 [Cylindrobasidium torrendii FP15055 ss-10]
MQLAFSKLVTFVILAVSAYATPVAQSAKHATHRKRVVGRGLEIDSYHPISSYQTFGLGKAKPASLTSLAFDSDIVATLATELGIDASSIAFSSGYHKEDEGMSYGYAKQVHNGVEFANAVANIAYKDGKIVAIGSSFVNISDVADSIPSIPLEDVIPDLEEKLNGQSNDFKSLKYLVRDDSTVSLTHAIQIHNDEVGTWVEAFVDAHTGELISIVDFVSNLSYRVLPITHKDPTEGFELLVDPENTASSPNGWVTTNTTGGNNVIATYQSERATVSSPDVFNYTYDTTASPSTEENLNAARVNAFYVANTYHDILYQYGFTETAHNFQSSNFDKGGVGSDPVWLMVQDSLTTNNAAFTVLPEGQPSLCRMFLWTFTDPQRDGDLENDILVHEMTHGLTNRMTGGGTGNCLQTNEAGGMGEGWSDAVAFWSEQTDATVRDYTLAAWVRNDPAGGRSHPYSTDESVNPLRYSSIADLNEVHDIGEVWANILINVYAALVAEHGFSTEAKTDASGTEGNTVWLHLLVDALALQLCNPTLATARDAWIQADQNRYNGENYCLLWKAFASRGLGVDAANYIDSAEVPSDC